MVGLTETDIRSALFGDTFKTIESLMTLIKRFYDGFTSAEVASLPRPAPGGDGEEEQPQSEDENKREKSYTVDAGGPRLRARKRQAPFSAKANISK